MVEKEQKLKESKEKEQKLKESKTKEQILKEQILLGTMQVFNQKGLKFTMDEVAKELGMSKKTIYHIFDTKEDIFTGMVDYVFGKIAEKKKEVMENTSLSTLEKIRKILVVMPESYKEIDFRQLYPLREKYPDIYKAVEKRLETGWEETIALLQQGMDEGILRKVPIPLVKLMMEASLEQFFQRDILVENNISYQEGLQEVVDILLDGIVK